MNRNSIIITLVIIAAIFGGYFIFRGGEVLVPIPKNDTIVAFGDSLVQGVGSTSGNDFVSVASRKLGMPIVNEGRSGDTTEAALSRIDAVLAHDPGLVIILLGGNDYLRRMPKETTFKNLRTMVERLREKGAEVLLLGVRGGLLRDTYEADFKSFSRDENVAYVPNVLDGLIGNKELMSDEIHPNDKGYAKIADRVVEAVEKIYK